MIIKANETAKDSTLTANSTLSGFPVSNVLDSRLTRVYKTNSNTTCEIVFAAAAAIDVAGVAIDNHNITSGATIKIEGNTTNSWGAPAFTQVLTWSAGIINGDFTKQNYQYWRISIVDGSNPDGFISLGRVWIGDTFNAPGIKLPFIFEPNTTSEWEQSRSGQTYGDIKYQYLMVPIKWPIATEAQITEFLNIYELVDGGIPHFITFDKGGAYLGTLYITWDNKSLRITQLGRRNFWTLSGKYKQEVKG